MPRSWRRPQHQKQTFAAQNSISALPPKADMCGALAHVCFGPEADMRLLLIKLYFGALAFRYASFAKSTNIESDLLWVLHVKKPLLGKFACEVWIDLPERGEGGLQFSRLLQVPQGSDPM